MYSFATPSKGPPDPTGADYAVAPTVGESFSEVQITDSSASDPKLGDLRKHRDTIRHRRGLTVGSGSDADKPAVMQANNKKNLQPIRLPPLNLLPLDTPFHSKMASFPAPSAEVDERLATPPPKRSGHKTPSTPLTASKATFLPRGHEDGPVPRKHLRSSSSAYNLRPVEPPAFDGLSTVSIPEHHSVSRQTTTPFASMSLPKNNSEFSYLSCRPSADYSRRDTDAEALTKPSGPRVLTKKEASSSTHTSTSTEPETPSSGSSLRRKLSLSGWRRSSSKASPAHPLHSHSHSHSVAAKSEEQPPQPPKHGDMPPPRLPASATWSGSMGTSPSPSDRTRPSLDFRRRKPSTVTVASDTEVDKSRPLKPNGTQGLRAPSVSSEQPVSVTGPPKSSSSILTPMQRMLTPKNSASVLKARHLDSNLGRDELAADEEMRKLASKRKDFEAAARDVDELRKRAKAQERVSPDQALQMVNLNIFERGEIIDYKEIYFCGTKNAKKHVGDLNAQSANFGYDDDRGDYNMVLGDHLAYRYEVVDMLGKGSFGQVVRCVDHRTGHLVAVKIIRNKKRFHQQALVEVNILQKLREWVRVWLRVVQRMLTNGGVGP